MGPEQGMGSGGGGGGSMPDGQYHVQQQQQQPGSSQDTLGQITLSMQLSGQQIQLVNNHLFSIQTMSSAQVRVAPGAPGLFYLMISGSEQHVESAKTLISAVLEQSNTIMG
jgi:CUG-BP- and ETR3-like factor